MVQAHPTTQARSRTAILGYLAAAGAGCRLDRTVVVDWFARHRLAVRDRGLRDALALRRVRQGDRPPTEDDPAESAWIRETLDFDATKLDLDLAVVIFPRSNQSDQLLGVLHSTTRVIRVYQGYDRDLVALILYDGAAERRRVQTLLEEFEPRLQWIVVRDVDDSFAARTWLALAQRTAEQESLLTE